MPQYVIFGGIILALFIVIIAINVTKGQKANKPNVTENNVSTTEAVYNSSNKESKLTNSLYDISDISELEKNNITVTIPEEVTIYHGNTQKMKMKASVKPIKMVDFRSEDEEIATVIDKVIIGKKVGTTSIITTAFVKDKYYEFTTKVTVKPGKVTVTADKEIIEVGETARLKTMVSSGVISGLSYSSDNEEIAVVRKHGIYGIVEGISEGIANITVRTRIGGRISTRKLAFKSC